MTIAVRNRDVTFVDEAGVRKAKVDVFGRFTTLTGYAAEEFEDAIEIAAPKGSTADRWDEMTYIKKTFALRVGRYRLGVAVKDANTHQTGTFSGNVVVAER